MSESFIKGCHHVALVADDFEKSCAFYEALGLVPVVGWGEGDHRIRMFDMGDGTRLELFAGGSDAYQAEGKYKHLAFAVDDVDAAYTHALSVGAVSLTPPKSVPLPSTPEAITIRIAFVLGPSGEQLEFFKEV